MIKIFIVDECAPEPISLENLEFIVIKNNDDINDVFKIKAKKFYMQKYQFEQLNEPDWEEIND